MTTTPTCRICFVSHSAYAAMRGRTDGQIGGIERQQAMMAKWLARRGHAVSMLTWDEGGPEEETIDGVRVIKICRQRAGLPGMRFFHPKWTRLNRAMRQADADVYYQNCGECFTGQAAMWTRRHGRRFVFSVASDADCDPALAELASRRERWLYRYGLRHADRVIVQTCRQQEMLLEGFHRQSVVIPMPSEGVTDAGPRRLGDRPRRVLWIGRVCEVKRPDRLLEVARGCPQLQFDMVGPAGEDDYARRVLAEAGSVANLRVHGAVAFGDVARHYHQAAALLCTSNYEGFPNTFLEAWSCGLPVVSTFDPDGLIAREGLGAVAADVPGLLAALGRLLQDEPLYLRCSANARRYFLANHPVEEVMPRFEQVFLEVASANEASAAGGSELCELP